MTTTTNAPTLPTDRHDVDIAARVAYAAYLAAGRKHNATVLSAPARIRQVYRRMQADQFAGDYARADIDAVVKWGLGSHRHVRGVPGG